MSLKLLKAHLMLSYKNGKLLMIFSQAGVRSGKKVSTKIRQKQPKASKKVKFISEYLRTTYKNDTS
jgi:hypothetical protein